MLFLFQIFDRLAKRRLLSCGLVFAALLIFVNYNDEISATLYNLLATKPILGLIYLFLYFCFYILVLSLFMKALLNIILKVMDFSGK